MPAKKVFKLGDVVVCRCPPGTAELPMGLPNNARAKVIATYIGATYVLYEGNNYVVPNACVHSGSDDSGMLELPATPPDAPPPASPAP
ncbi:MAG TPA: hypothetical protein VFZ59_16015 [Verrucomicrobiae bacterium]|nr:hypothetical protein [Verrucomicrobiae bacterium]